MSLVSVPRITYQDFLAARQLARHLFITTVEAAELLQLTATSRATAPEILLIRWRVALIAAKAVHTAQLRARITAHTAIPTQA